MTAFVYVVASWLRGGRAGRIYGSFFYGVLFPCRPLNHSGYLSCRFVPLHRMAAVVFGAVPVVVVLWRLEDEQWDGRAGWLLGAEVQANESADPFAVAIGE